MLIPLIAQAANVRVNIDGEMVAFSDVPETEWYAPYVKAAAEAGIVSGYKDANGNLTGKFGPGKNVSIAETLKIAVEGAGYNPAAYTPASTGVWWGTYLGVARDEGIFPFGAPDCCFYDGPATRAEVAQMIADAFKLNLENDPANYYDDVRWDTPHAHAIAALTEGHIAAGDTDANGNPIARFRPTDPVNRAEVVKMIITARAVYGTSERTSSSSSDDGVPTVSYTDNGFVPSTLHMSMDSAVRVRNDSSSDLIMASDPHPTHTDYIGLNSNTVIKPGFDFIAQFGKKGTYGYHNHLNPSQKGTIIVE